MHGVLPSTSNTRSGSPGTSTSARPMALVHKHSIASSVASSSSSSSSSPHGAAEQRVSCKICGDAAQGYHFGAFSCHACGAFFRRSVSNQQQYTCLRNANCRVGSRHTRGMCKYCRFKRCIDEGMNIGVIVVKPTDEFRQFPADSSLRKILLASRATFVNRYAASLKASGGDRNLVRIGTSQPTIDSTMMASMGELVVLQQYVVDAGFPAIGLSVTEAVQLTRQLFYAWLHYQSVMATMRNSGHRRNRAYFVDESNLPVETDAIEKYIHSFGRFLDPEMICRHTRHHFDATLEAASMIATHRPEEFETAVLFQMFAMKTAATLRK
ncbi:Protein CBR-NHR-38 [Aphelenchoides fujianensis]|nr:Protein CBR-NHR-38 [Aphelenchoides fujianensis]